MGGGGGGGFKDERQLSVVQGFGGVGEGSSTSYGALDA